VFGESDDFRDALGGNGVTGYSITGYGQFRARLTRIALHRLCLAAGEEVLPRIAFIVVPANIVLVLLPIGEGPSPIWGGIDMRAGEIVTLGPGQRFHATTGGPCRWGAIQVPDQDLAEYGRAVSGGGFFVPPAARWRPRPTAGRDLRRLHRAAIRMAEIGSGIITDVEAAHGLEQQLVHALIECLSEGSAEEETPAERRHREILARFEDLLQAEPTSQLAQIYKALGVSDRLLRECCRKHLGMGPNRYGRLQRMQQAHGALQKENPHTANVSEVARRHGFHDPGRFAANYRAVYGQSPSTTLRRSSQGVAELSLRRPV
jgi:AraC-like DNA-binding protein